MKEFSCQYFSGDSVAYLRCHILTGYKRTGWSSAESQSGNYEYLVGPMCFLFFSRSAICLECENNLMLKSLRFTLETPN